MNFIKKHLKWLILGITFLIIAIIAFIDYKQIYVALTLIPSVLLSFLQSNNEKQEELAAMQIENLKKAQREQENIKKSKKMLDFTFKTLVKKQNNKLLNDIERKISNIKLDVNFPIHFLLNNIQRCVGGISCATPREPKDMENNFYQNLKSMNDNGEKYIDILGQELKKILTPDVFDGEKLIVKDE